MDSKEEYSRLLSNPDHVILSDDLQDLIGDGVSEQIDENDDHQQRYSSILLFNEDEAIFQVSIIKKITNNVFSFTGFSPNFFSKRFIEGEEFDLKILGSYFQLEEGSPVVYRSNGKLTFTARRIFKNEEV